jgi:hypothetical protein
MAVKLLSVAELLLAKVNGVILFLDNIVFVETDLLCATLVEVKSSVMELQIAEFSCILGGN